MTTYKLPEQLGGTEVHDATSVHPIVFPDNRPRLTVVVPGLGELTVPLEYLTRVKPPLPEEPDDNTAWSDGDVVYSRRDGWPSSSAEHRWYSTSGGGPDRWDVVCRETCGRPLTRLVPDPAADAPELPYRATDADSDWVVIERRPGGTRRPGCLNTSGRIVYLTASQCRQLAAALLVIAEGKP